MPKKYRVVNNFAKWFRRSIPFFLVLFFVMVNFTLFVLQPTSFLLQSLHGWNQGHTEKKASLSTFESIYSLKYMNEMTQQLDIYYLAKDDFPKKLEDLHIYPDEKNWIYKPSFKTYDLIYTSRYE